MIGEGGAFHRSSPDGDHGEKADLHSPENSRSSRVTRSCWKVGDCCESRNTLVTRICEIVHIARPRRIASKSRVSASCALEGAPHQVRRRITSRCDRDPGLAADWSVAQLLGSLLPIRLCMRTPSQLYLMPSMTAIALVMAAPHALVGQTLSARPASVSLTVVVPSHPHAGAALTTDGGATVVQRGATTLNVETMVGLVERPASRVEVRLGPGWSADSARVLVRNRNGEFERLASDASVVAMDTPAWLGHGPSALQFRITTSNPVAARVAIPVEYRITVGASDQFTVWTFPSLVRVDASR